MDLLTSTFPYTPECILVRTLEDCNGSIERAVDRILMQQQIDADAILARQMNEPPSEARRPWSIDGGMWWRRLLTRVRHPRELQTPLLVEHHQPTTMAPVDPPADRQ